MAKRVEALERLVRGEHSNALDEHGDRLDRHELQFADVRRDMLSMRADLGAMRAELSSLRTDVGRIADAGTVHGLRIEEVLAGVAKMSRNLVRLLEIADARTVVVEGA